MKPKILVLYKKEDQKNALEEIFAEIVEKGVEVFFTDDLQNALEISNTEKPQCVLLDPSFENKHFTNAHSLDNLDKNSLLEICMKHLDLSEIIEELPM